MEDHDDWRLGDEGESGTCPRCGKRNRPGLSSCTICGTRLGSDLETDPGSLRAIGETMGRPRPNGRGRGRGRHSLRAWTISAVVLLLVIAVLTWLETRETPFRLEDLIEPPEITPAPVAAEPTALATRVARPTLRPPVPTPRSIPPTARPIAPTARPVAPTVHPMAPTARPMTPPEPPILRPQPPPAPVVVPPPARTAPPPPIELTPERERTLILPPAPPVATEKPSLGTDLQDATRAYRAAVDVHNASVDEYNALADEIQRRDAWTDDPDAVALRRRLDRAREAVEAARVEAESLRTRMEAVRSRYR
jgi:hypothetical protein